MPLLFDMGMEKLTEYRGRNPKPDDFEAYWDRGLAEMRATDPAVELVPGGVKTGFAECFDLFFTGVGGARVRAKLVRPKGSAKPGPAVLHFHGYSGASAEWTSYLSWAAAGMTVAALDCRGQGGMSEDPGAVRGTTFRGHIIRGIDDAPEKLLFRQIFLDTAQLARVVMGMEGVDAGRVGAYGGSQGGGLTLACCALEPRIKRAVPVYPFLSDYQRVWEMDQAVAAYAELKEYFRAFDPLHLREREIFTRLGYIDVHHLAPRIRAEILMPMGLMDTVCPPSTQFAAYNAIPSKKSLLLFPDFGHEGLPGVQDRTFEFLQEL